MRTLAVALAVAALSACASAPTKEQVQAADYGDPMSPEQCTELIEAALSYGLKDPGSAQFRHPRPCAKGWMSSVPLLGFKAIFGYEQSGQINGKNSFGAYVGFRDYVALVRNGRVVRYCIDDADGICLPVGDKE